MAYLAFTKLRRQFMHSTVKTAPPPYPYPMSAGETPLHGKGRSHGLHYSLKFGLFCVWRVCFVELNYDKRLGAKQTHGNIDTHQHARQGIGGAFNELSSGIWAAAGT